MKKKTNVWRSVQMCVGTVSALLVFRCDYATLKEVVFVRPSVPCCFRTSLAVFYGKKSSNDIIINDTISDDEVVTSDVPPRYLYCFPPSVGKPR